jgi:hypothetical protein
MTTKPLSSVVRHVPGGMGGISFAKEWRAPLRRAAFDV